MWPVPDPYPEYTVCTRRSLQRPRNERLPGPTGHDAFGQRLVTKVGLRIRLVAVKFDTTIDRHYCRRSKAKTLRYALGCQGDATPRRQKVHRPARDAAPRAPESSQRPRLARGQALRRVRARCAVRARRGRAAPQRRARAESGTRKAAHLSTTRPVAAAAAVLAAARRRLARTHAAALAAPAPRRLAVPAAAARIIALASKKSSRARNACGCPEITCRLPPRWMMTFET